MKKLIIFMASALLTFGTAIADDCFSVGENDTLIVYPSSMVNGMTVPVHASFSGRLDEWDMYFTYPGGMVPWGAARRPGMTIQYLNYQGDTVSLNAPLTVDHDYIEFNSAIWQFGYRLNGYEYEPYGTVKWEAGYYDNMFEIQFEFESDFCGGILYIDGQLKSSLDMRGGTIGADPVTFSKSITVILGYRPGDVNGDGVLNNADVTALIAYIMGDVEDWDQYQIAAADVNHDGYINVADVNTLINLILSQ